MFVVANPGRSIRSMITLCSLATLLLAGCEQGTPVSSPPLHGKVRATDAYTRYFGEAPLPEQGLCFARSWFFPVRDEPTRLLPVPLFLFDDQNEMPQIVTRMLAMSKFVGSSAPFEIPFPAGMELRHFELAERTARLNLVYPGEPLEELRLQSIAASLTETLAQFDTVDKVYLSINGRPWAAMPPGGFRGDAGRVVPPGPPRLLMAAGSWEPGADNPHELLINFDRPMHVRSIDVRLADGRPVRGEYFHSVYKMAVVIRPERPELLKEGTKLKVRWAVSDRMGRSAEGEEMLGLLRF